MPGGRRRIWEYKCVCVRVCLSVHSQLEFPPNHLNRSDRKLLWGRCSDLALYTTRIRQTHAFPHGKCLSWFLRTIHKDFIQHRLSTRSVSIQPPAEGASITACQTERFIVEVQRSILSCTARPMCPNAVSHSDALHTTTQHLKPAGTTNNTPQSVSPSYLNII